ncbi:MULTISPECIES: acetyl-CoA carboxylase biotin carboxylase subunit [Sphingomonadales]|jgi:acetyl-CoA carboxylase biotin carboxylase subunit|uniref:Biotin carboxylase subunit of acetyl-CoA carboxylase-like enzyme n=3 Tax=Sphingomonadales TaxID=204457 RepID=N1MTK7_9SPHN|nr:MULTISPECIES: biotin carboxylase N-terminal domain-containing protein [Sphingomonadales]MBU0835258.1 ATP-grasp domain-containing protein [Alphaproteobacteria bacterium]RIV83749.1 ATP-grasp domain-containing protein [Aurantiacibacter xanthus]BBF72364.1 acetyl-CoA carboxylase biotin carboxylase subunit [Sphingomonas bisphenolicum]CCW18992.1 biotin carboxylase subunit of acetyl-CoA carboxylase-like enzyme [Sphingobium indicum BiD32]|tara:strand:+ start:1294 stop:2631 length:1338 start_codon:yes stop_codon:yes gene_type:complete
MIRRLLIANRGEIAFRVIRTAKRLGIETVLGASEADLNSAAAWLADHIVKVGPAPSAQSYLDVAKVIAATKLSGADALHPGYGFLSENVGLARACAEAGIAFVGPSSSSLEAMGDKLMARKVGIEAGLPVVPGGEAGDKEEARRRAQETGYPLLLKAVSGGGGKGMKRVDNESQLDGQIDLAMAEAQASFGDPRIYVERFITSGRHIEVQVLGDGVNAIHLGTRDCSIQRRFQKLVEEAPAALLPDDKRTAIEQAAVDLAKFLAYRGAGTVEFLVDAVTFDFYFLEMNARIQVEHPVTEAITGVDLIEQQLLVAAGSKLALTQEMIRPRGHAIEVRINAENWREDFQPSPGRAASAKWPAGEGIRVDTHIFNGGLVPPFYDSLAGKLIVHGNDRAEAIERLTAALSVFELEGMDSTAGLHAIIAADPRFRAGDVDTRFFGNLNNG